MMKYRLIWHRLTKAMVIIIGPSTASNRPKIILLSMTPKSVENLLTKMPEGLLSKYFPGQRIIDSIIFSWTV